MDIQQLRYIVALSQEMHFNRAAKSVHVTQPTLSQGIKKIEDEIGAKLFERSPQKVKLTKAGEDFLPYAINVLDELQKGVSAVREDSKEIIGHLKVGVIPTICPYLMPNVLIEMRKKAPRLKFELFEEKTPNLLEKLKKGQIDLGVLSLPIKDKSIANLSLGKEPFYIAISKKRPLSKRNSISMKDVLKERLLILKEGHCFGDQSMEYCKLQRKDPQVIFQGSSLTSVVKLVMSGEGITFVPKMAIKDLPQKEIKYLPLIQPTPNRELGIIWRMSSALDRTKRFCLETIKTSARSIL